MAIAFIIFIEQIVCVTCLWTLCREERVKSDTFGWWARLLVGVSFQFCVVL